MSPRLSIVVSRLEDLPELGIHVTAADHYLSSGGAHPRDLTVVNLCRSYRYRSKGYYVSLVADARGHRVLPAIETLEELAEPYGVFRVLREAGIPTLGVDELEAWKPGGARQDTVAEVAVIFGESSDPRFGEVARAAYRAWPIPALRLHLVHGAGEWRVANVQPISLNRLRPHEREALVRALKRKRVGGILQPAAPVETKRASIAVLSDDDEPFSPSTPETIRHLERVAAAHNIYVHRLGLDEIDRLAEYDALFIRTLTGVREPSFQFALRAEMLDMPVIDDPQSIIRCSNKVFLEELLRREGIPTPRTMIITPRSTWREVSALGTPLVVKLPDGSFSAAVYKVENEKEYDTVTGELFRRSPLLIAQEFVRTDYDWRVTVLDGRVLFVARYYMAEGHWQIRSEELQGERYGRVEAVPRANAPRGIAELAQRAAALIGRGLYGVDLKEGPNGPLVIEINDNPNLDRGEEDTGDGDTVYEDILRVFVSRIEQRPAESGANGSDRDARKRRRHYRPFSVAGMELEYAVVDENLEPVSLVEDAFRRLAGRATSDVDLGGVAFSNEIADHVFEVKTPLPTRSLRRAEEALVDGVRRFSSLLEQEFGARLLPTGMHPWLDPGRARLWKRSGHRVYQAYAKIFDIQTHGWLNVHAAHLNLPMGRGAEAVAMYNVTALLIPYLPALAASSPMYDGALHEPVDNRLIWIFRHQQEVPETQGDILPEPVSSLTDYRRRILQPMYDAIGARPGGAALKHDFLNARGAVLKFSRRALEIRVLDVQECVKMDIAIAVFARAVLRYYAHRFLSGRMDIPPRRILLGDFRSTIACGSAARVVAPQFGDTLDRDDEGKASVRDCLYALLDVAQRTVRSDEAAYLDLVRAVIDAGPLSERIRTALTPFQADPVRLKAEARAVYSELCDCLVTNTPWSGRGFRVS